MSDSSRQICGTDPFATPRRVLHVAQPPDGGVARYVDQITKFQAEHGWKIHAATAFRTTGSGVIWHEWCAVRNPLKGVVHEGAALTAVLRQATPDVVVLHSSKAGLVGRLTLRGSVTTVHVPHAWSFLSMAAGPAQGALAWERLAGHWTNATILVSPGEAEIGTRRRMRAPQFVVENPVPEGWLDVPLADRRQSRALLGIPEGPTAVCVARLSRQKGIDVLMDAWAHLRSTWPSQRTPEPNLLIVGGGDPGAIAALARPGIMFVGAVDNPRAYLDAADVFVLSSRWEGLSLAMLEAMASGRSVVTTDVAGSHLVTRSGCGAVVPIEDSLTLASELRARLIDGELARREGLRAREYVSAHHRPEDAYTRFSAVVARAHAFGVPASRRTHH